ncbi:hypothetical protein Tco_0685149 [Tanacetum coccineum]
MITLVKFMIIAGADNHPPMLEKSMYDSWKSRMELYIENRENERMSPGPEYQPSPEFVPEPLDLEEDPEEDDDEDPEEDPADYPADGGDDGDDEDESSDDDEDDDVDIEGDEEEEGHPAPADSTAVALPAVDHTPSAEETKPFKTDESTTIPPSHLAYRVTARISIQDEPPIPFWSDTEVARLLVIPTPPPSPLSPWSSPLP